MADWEGQPDDNDNGDAEWDEEPKSVSPSLLQKIRRFIFSTPGEKAAERTERITQLSEAIEQYPDSAANYLLRGEVRLEDKQYELAHADFQQALELADAQFDNDAWGITAQSVMDKARFGLRQVNKHLD